MVLEDRRTAFQRLYLLAESQGGYFGAGQAISCGYGYRLHNFHVHRGSWIRVARGVFRLRAFPTGNWEDLIRMWFWSLRRGVVSHESALAFHRLGDVLPDQIHLTVPPGFRKRDEAVALHHGDIPAVDVENHPGFRVTTPVRSLLDCAQGALPQEQLNAAIRDAIRGGVPRWRLGERGTALTERGRRRLDAALQAPATA